MIKSQKTYWVCCGSADNFTVIDACVSRKALLKAIGKLQLLEIFNKSVDFIAVRDGDKDEDGEWFLLGSTPMPTVEYLEERFQDPNAWDER